MRFVLVRVGTVQEMGEEGLMVVFRGQWLFRAKASVDAAPRARVSTRWRGGRVSVRQILRRVLRRGHLSVINSPVLLGLAALVIAIVLAEARCLPLRLDVPQISVVVHPFESVHLVGVHRFLSSHSEVPFDRVADRR